MRAAILLALLAASTVLAQDIRDKYGTRSLEAAKAFEEGMKLAQQGRYDDALAPLKTAAKLDPDFQIAYYWLAYAYENLGDIKQALASYERLLEVSPPGRITNITVDGCFTAGLMLAKLEKEEESWIWFSRVALLDPDNRFKIHAKAYRNMSIALSKKGRSLSAALTALLGYKADSSQVERELVRDLLKEADEANEESAQMLYFSTARDVPAPRKASTSVAIAAVDGDIEDRVTRFVLDSKGRRLFAFGPGSDRFYAIDYARNLKVAALKAPGTITASTVANGQLYLVVANPPRLIQADPATGASVRAWNLTVENPFSVAVLAPDRLAVFPVRGVLHVLDLDSGDLSKTDFAATIVETDPEQKNCYAIVRPDPRSESGHIIVDGRPVFFHVSDSSWLQTTLYRYAVAGRKLILAGVRLNAASNGQNLHVSADGRWTTVAGGGGWRPENPGTHKTGYRVAVLPTGDFQNVVGSFHVDAYPLAAGVNPVTGQLAVVRDKDLKIHHLSSPDGNPPAETGAFGPACAWSGDGRFLVVAGTAKGVSAWRNQLSPEEEASCEKWLRDLEGRVAKRGAPASKPAAEPVKDIAAFKPLAQRADVVRMMARAEKAGRTTKPVAWQTLPAYAKDPELSAYLANVEVKLSTKDYGILIFQLQERLRKIPEHGPLNYYLGLCFCFTNQHEKAEPALLATLKADEGRTTLSVAALRALAGSRRVRKDPVAAAHCMAAALLLDLANPELRDDAARFFREAGLEAESASLLKKAGGATPAGPASGKLPPLASVAPGKALKAIDLYRLAAPSVVRVESGGQSGSGVCVGEPGLVLTNAHVLVDGRREATVHPFAWDRSKLVRLKPVQAEVIHFAPDRDLAILRMVEAPKSLVPLLVADRESKAGEKIFAIGSPAMGGDLLDQSITEGIVSSPARKVGRFTFLQHTAAVNPGNSGGPLFDECGQVLGLVTLKAQMENVSFAIPAGDVRSLFPAASK